MKGDRPLWVMLSYQNVPGFVGAIGVQAWAAKLFKREVELDDTLTAD